MSASDQIILEDLEVHYHVGVPDAERRHAQRLLISITIDHDFEAAQATDDLTKTIDYGAIAIGLKTFGDSKEWKLIEKLGNDIAQWVIAEFGAPRVAVEVKKFILPDTKHVAVRLVRARN